MKKYLILIAAIVADYNLNVITSANLPQIHLIALYLISISSSSLSIMVLFLFGMVHDILNMNPIGLTATLYITMYAYILYYQKKDNIHNSHLSPFIKSIILLTCIEWLLLSFHHLVVVPIRGMLFSQGLTILTYLLISKFNHKDAP